MLSSLSEPNVEFPRSNPEKLSASGGEAPSMSSSLLSVRRRERGRSVPPDTSITALPMDLLNREMRGRSPQRFAPSAVPLGRTSLKAVASTGAAEIPLSAKFLFTAEYLRTDACDLLSIPGLGRFAVCALVAAMHRTRSSAS